MPNPAPKILKTPPRRFPTKKYACLVLKALFKNGINVVKNTKLV